MSAYTLTINGGAATRLESLGISFTGMTLVNMQADAVDLMWFRRRVSEACPFEHNDTVEIFSGSRRLFRGRARRGSTTSGSVAIKIIGPWSHFEELTSQMSVYTTVYNTFLGLRVGDTYDIVYDPGDQILKTDGTFYTVPAGPDLTVTWTVAYARTYVGGATTGTVNVNDLWSARHWLFKITSIPGQIYTTLADQFDLVTGYVDHVAAGLVTFGDFSWGGMVAPRLRTIADTMVSEVIRQTLAMKPDAALWWDYSGTGLPVVNGGVASLETPLTLTIGIRDGQALSNYVLAVADELVPDGVVISWEGSVSEAAGIGQVLVSDTYPVNTSRLSPRVLQHTIEFADTPAVTGMAQEVYTSLSVRRAQGQLDVIDTDFSLGLRPGRTIYLTGDPQLEGIQLWVQSVSWDPGTGIARLTVGYPAHLALRDRIDLRGWFRLTMHDVFFTTTQIVPP